MKKNLRLLCLGLAAATITCGFAQEDKTSLLKNADMELGLKGWSFDGVDVVGKNTKLATTKIGFHGMSNGVQEAWHSSVSNPLGDSYVMQRLSNLPSGTYVFGAYAAAAKQHNRNDICERNAEGGHILIENAKGEKVHQYSDWWSNRDSIYGVVLFANDDTVRVATDNPDMNERGVLWAHSSKFNVAVTLTDADEKKGYMDLGMRVAGTNANYIVWDNATLYYFGDMSKEDALDAMAEIDMTKAAAIADTLTAYVMQNDTLAALVAAIDAAAAKTSTAATLWDDSEEIHQAAGLARKSITDYANLKKNIETAVAVYNCDAWQYVTEDYLPMLGDFLKVAEEAYAAKEMDRAALTELRSELNWYVGAVKFDSVYVALDELTAFMEEVKNKEGQPGGYSAVQYNTLEELNEELLDTMAYFEETWGEAYDKEYFNPNNIWPYVARVYAAIEEVKNNPLSAEYTSMPIEFKTAENGWIEGASWLNESKKLVQYQSPMYRFEGPISNFRITVKKAKNGQVYFCLSELEFFDGTGAKIEVDETMLSTNADHNTLNGTPDGGGIAALFDGDNDTYFHSAWQNGPSESHYLEVNLPNGGYDTFSFKMISRSNSNGWDQSHTFPGEMVISTPMPKREELEGTLARAKALNAYSGNEVGFYEKDFGYLTDAIAEVEAALEGWPSESECVAMNNNLKKQISSFEADEEKSINLPEVGVKYRFISALPGYYEQQSVEKALTIRGDSALYWENVCADSLNQVFELEPIMHDGEPLIETKSGTNSDGSEWSEDYYCYILKNVAGRIVEVDSVSTSVPVTLKLVDETNDTVRLKSLGTGQWNVIVKGSGSNQFHTNGHGNGSGVGHNIVAWNGELNSASAWFIREMPELPLNVLVSGAEFKSECIHFDAANTITLTANKNCAFKNLALYDMYGKAIAIDSLVVSGNKATITATTKDFVQCAFAFTNNEGVSSVSFNAFQFTADITRLQAAYDVAVAVAPVEGTEVMQYADLSAYNAALAEAEAMLEAGAETAEIDAMIAKLEAVVAALVPNMPEAGKYYNIFSGLAAFEKNHGYRMAMYTKESKLWWAQENECEWNRLWQFEPATEAELTALEVEDAANVKAYYIKNVATGKYIGKADGKSTQIEMTSAKSSTVPYTITALQGSIVALAGANDATNRLHGAGHGEGANKNGSIVYWNSGLGTASIWTISEAQYDATDIDFSEIEPETAVVKGTFDLFGRRVVAPTAPGIYIIDGRKKLVK